MNDKNNESKPTNDPTVTGEQVSACGPGCSCGNSESTGKMRWIVGVVVLCAAAALVVRAVTKNKDVSADKAPTGFPTLAVTQQGPVPDGVATPTNTVDVKEIGALSELNTVAADMVGVFVFLPGKADATAKAPIAQMLGASKTIEPQLRGGKIGVFTLKAESANYNQIAAQMTVPGVLAMVKGGGMSATSGEITETKIVQAFVAAASSGGCGTGGCGPSGCK